MRAFAKLWLFVLFVLFAVSTASAAINPWSSAASASGARGGHTTTLLPTGKVLVAGGSSGPTILASAELYDPASNAWTSAASLATPRQFHTATLLHSGKLLVVAGNNGAALASAELYDPASNSWSSAGTLNHARQQHTATLLPNGKVLVVGGYDGNPDYSASAELYDPATNAWTNATSLSTARYLHTATLLANGKVLVTGGYGTASYLATAELYDPASNAWTSAGTALLGRDSHTATLLATGKVLVFGGNSGGGTKAYPELYDPATNAWSLAGTGPGALPGARYNHSATLLPSGRVLIAGGYNSGYLNTAELYDPVANSWVPAGNLLTMRALHTATLLPTGDVLVVGGDNSGGALASAESYRAATEAWSAGGTLTTARTSFTASLLPNGKVLAVGGNFATNTELYDPATNTWSAAADSPILRLYHTATLLPSGKLLIAAGLGSPGSASLYDAATNTWSAAAAPTARASHSATLLASGKVLIAGGIDVNPLASAQLYDPALNTWSSTGALAIARKQHTATLLPSGKVLVAGGYATGVLASVELYDPAAGTWSAAGSLTVARTQHTATLLPSGKVLVVGGVNNDAGSSQTATAEIYDPATNVWSSAGTLTTARAAHTAILLSSGRVLIAGGVNTAGDLASAEIYDPATNTWTPAASLATARTQHAAALLPSGKLLLCGGNNNGVYPLNAELFDPGLAPDAKRQPSFDTTNAFLLHTSALAATAAGSINDATTGAITRTGFMPPLEANSGGTASSAGNAPVLQIQRLDNGQMMFVPNDESVAISDTNFTGASGTFTNFPLGPVLVRAWVNGVPSAAQYTALGATPGAPAAPVATGQVLQATVTFTAPADSGSSAIDSYSVIASPGGASYNCLVPCSSAVFDLDPGNYTFTVLAHNALGFGPASPPSNSVTVTQAHTTITISSLGNPTALGATANFTAVLNNAVNPTGNVTFCADATDIFDCTGGTPLCTVAVSSGTMACATNALSAGSHQIRAWFPGDIDNERSSSRLTQLVGTAPAITSASSATFKIGVPGSFTVTTSGVPTPTIDFATVVPQPAGISFVDNGNGTATISGAPGPGSVGAHPLTINARNTIPPDAAQSFALIVVKGDQVLTLPPQSPASHVFVANGTFAITPPASSASPNSGNPIVYSSLTSGVCLVSGTTVTMIATGTCTIAADQAGNADYNAAVQVTQNVAIGLATQTITNFFATPANPVFAPSGFAASFAVSATGGASGNPVIFSIAPASASVCSSSGSTITTLGAGTCIVHADQAGNASYAAAPQATLNVTIAKAAQTITFGSAPLVPVSGNGTVTATTTATPGANYPIVFSSASADCSVSAAGVVSGIRAGSNNCVVTATQAGGANYNSASATQTLSIGRKSSIVTLTATPNPAAGNTPVTLTVTVVGDPPTGSVQFCDGAVVTDASCTGGTSLCTSALISGATSSTAVCSASFATPGTHSLTAYYAGDSNFLAAATANAFALTVSAAPPAPAVPAPLDRRAMLLLGALMAAIGAVARSRRQRR